MQNVEMERYCDPRQASSVEISVIVPVYGVERYLRECVDSILAQTFQDFECILVDDGSPDRCAEICDAYARQDGRVRVIHQKNAGLSAARNAGITAAKGKYISFIDADDAVHPRFLEVLHRVRSEENAEIVACGYQRFQDGAPLPTGHSTDDRRCMSRKEAIHALTRVGKGGDGEQMVIAWNKLYARRLFDTVRYPVGKWHEDEFVILPLLLQTDKVVRCDAVLYFYRQRADSITGEAYQKDIRQLVVLAALLQRCELLRAREYRSIYSAVVSHYFGWMLYLIDQTDGQSETYGELRRYYLREMKRYGHRVRGERLFLFAVSPALYRKWRKYQEARECRKFH